MKVGNWIRRAVRRWIGKMPGIGGFTGGGMLGFSNLGNKRSQLEAYQHHVYKCVTLIYRRGISVPFSLYKERAGEDEEVKSHPFLDLMKKPNPYMSGTLLKAVTMMHLDLAGGAFWLKVFNGLGRPAELWPLPVQNFSRFIMKDGLLSAYEFMSDAGRPVTYEPEEICYFRYPHPLYMLEPCSPIQAMAFAYDTDLAIRKYQRNFFQNSARSDVNLETEQDIQPEDAYRILSSWKQNHRGVDKAWEPAILDKGLKASVMSVTAKDFEFAALASWSKEDILEAYNVPEGKLGSVKDVNRANALGIDITFNSECIKPRLDLFDEQVTLDILPLYDTGLRLEHVNCVPRDLDYDLKERESNLKNKLTVINEERAGMGLEPVPWGDAPWVAINEMQYGETLEIDRQDGKDVSRKGAKTQRVEAESSKLKAQGKGEAEDRVRVLHERRVAARSRAWGAWIRKFFKRQREGVLERLERLYPRIEGATAGMSRKKAEEWLAAHKDLTDQININLAESNRELAEGSTAYIEGALMAGGEEALAFVGSDAVFDLFSPQVRTWLAEKRTILERVNRTTYNQLNAQLVEGFQSGETMEAIADRVGQVFDHAERYRSVRIAQTETNSAANRGTLEGYRQSGVVERKTWVAGPGARETHAAAAATYSGDGAIPLDQDFLVGEGSGPAPGSIGVAAEDINCRCTIVPVVRRD